MWFWAVLLRVVTAVSSELPRYCCRISNRILIDSLDVCQNLCWFAVL